MPTKKNEKKSLHKNAFTLNGHIYNKKEMKNTLFRYKRGKMAMESNGDNKAANRLAHIDTIMYWLIRLIAVLTSGATITFLIKIFGTG